MNGRNWGERTNLTDPTEPTRRTRTSESGWMDTNVIADHRFSCRVFANYINGIARTATPGRTIAATAVVAPETPELTVVDTTPTTVTLAGVPGAHLIAVRCNADPQLAPGAIIDARQLARTGTALTADSHGHYVDRLTGGVVWYLPAGEVSSLSANHEGDRVVVRWDWPEGCTEAKIAWRMGTDPLSLEDPAATTAKVTNTTYGIKGRWILSGRCKLTSPGADNPNRPRLLVVAHPAGDTNGRTEGGVLGAVASGTSAVVVPLDGIRLPVVISVQDEPGQPARLRVVAPDSAQRTIT